MFLRVGQEGKLSMDILPEILEYLIEQYITSVRDIVNVCSICRRWREFKKLKWRIIGDENSKMIALPFKVLSLYPNIVMIKNLFVMLTRDNYVEDFSRGPTSKISKVKIVLSCPSKQLLQYCYGKLKYISDAFSSCDDFALHCIIYSTSLDNAMEKLRSSLVTKKKEEETLVLKRKKKKSGTEISYYGAAFDPEKISPLGIPIPFSALNYGDKYPSIMGLYLTLEHIHKNKEVRDVYYKSPKKDNLKSRLVRIDFLTQSLYSFLHCEGPILSGTLHDKFLKVFRGYIVKKERAYDNLDDLTSELVVSKIGTILEVLNGCGRLPDIKRLDGLMNRERVLSCWKKGLKLEKYHIFISPEEDPDERWLEWESWLEKALKDNINVQFYRVN